MTPERLDSALHPKLLRGETKVVRSQPAAAHRILTRDKNVHNGRYLDREVMGSPDKPMQETSPSANQPPKLPKLLVVKTQGARLAKRLLSSDDARARLHKDTPKQEESGQKQTEDAIQLLKSTQQPRPSSRLSSNDNRLQAKAMLSDGIDARFVNTEKGTNGLRDQNLPDNSHQPGEDNDSQSEAPTKETRLREAQAILDRVQAAAKVQHNALGCGAKR